MLNNKESLNSSSAAPPVIQIQTNSQPLSDDEYETMSESEDELIELDKALERFVLSEPKPGPSTSLKRSALGTPIKSGLRTDFIQKKPRKLIFSDHVLVTGWTFSFDNLNRTMLPSSFSTSSQSVMRNMVTAVAIKNRINMETDKPNFKRSVQYASNIPFQQFLPSENDLLNIKNDHLQLIKRILVKTIPFFISAQSRVEWHINHRHSELSEQQSQTVSC